jgi:hypothetical protein
MNLEPIPFRVAMRWLGLFTALFVAGAVLFETLSGLIPVLCWFAALLFLRPEVTVHHVTDAELEAWLSGGP